jgi:hypothetical protein
VRAPSAPEATAGWTAWRPASGGRRCLALTGLLLLACARPALADATLFIGTSSTAEGRRTTGFSIGAGLIIVGFEFEYARIREDAETGAPSVRTFMGNVLAQTPIAVSGLQFYGTVGGGFYRESFEADAVETNIGTNIGGGVKIGLAGPLRLRLDYRLFKLRGSAVAENPQRFYAGLNLAF